MLNAAQNKVVESNAPKILCLAGAGTGKTYSLVSRIHHLVNNGVAPSSILVLTFTNAAAFEMESRYTTLTKSISRMMRKPEFRTFHAFCYNLLKIDDAVRVYLGYSAVPDIADENEATKLLTQAKLQTGIKLSNIQWADPSNLSLSDKRNHEILKKAYDRLLRAKNVITFDTLCYGVCQMFVKDLEFIQRYKSQYKYIFVDEFQDTDKRQYEFVSSFKDSNLFVIGDALQSLYGFRGADSTLIKSLSDDPDWEVHKLTENYRSTHQICEYANSFSKYADKKYRVPISSDRNGADVHEYVYTTSFEPVRDKFVKSTLQDILSVHSSDVAILTRTNLEAMDIREWLASQGYHVADTVRLAYVQNIIKSASDSSYLLNWMYSTLPQSEATRYIKLKDPNVTIEGNIELMLSLSQSIKLQTLYADVLAIRNLIASSDDVDIQYSNCCEYLSISQNLHDPMQNVYERLLDDLSKMNDERPSVYVGTIHSSKGLEYDTVILLNVGTRKFPLISEENKNIFYVGITRAKNNLYVFKEDS